MTDQNINQFFDSKQLVKYIDSRKYPLLLITGLAFLISMAVSFVIEPKFKSTVVIFPTASTSISHELLTDNLYEKNIMKFGEDEEVEQMMQILQSDEIRNKISGKYNLMSHYNITSGTRYPKTKLKELFERNVSIVRTKYMSIEISVLDVNPDTAACIANDIASFLDTVINEMQNDRAQKALMIVEKEYLSLKDHISLLQDSILKIRQLGVFDYESQSEVFNDAYATALAEGRLEGAKKIEEKLQLLAEYGGSYALIRDLLVYEIEKLSILEAKYQEAKVDVEQDLPRKFIIDQAEPAERKSEPVRWMIVSMSTLLSFLFALLLLVIFDNIKKKR
ncbi:MAG: hypothetical protein ABIJ16_11080 [Bacteroidota bacterium]